MLMSARCTTTAGRSRWSLARDMGGGIYTRCGSPYPDMPTAGHINRRAESGFISVTGGVGGQNDVLTCALLVSRLEKSSNAQHEHTRNILRLQRTIDIRKASPCRDEGISKRQRSHPPLLADGARSSTTTQTHGPCSSRSTSSELRLPLEM